MLKNLQNLQKSNKGFTIIEVMIVLAIAGLIILIVLLAVPALQRNSRNTSLKNDVAVVTGAISEFASNNEGSQPVFADSTCTTPGDLVLKKAGAADSPAEIQGNTGLDCSEATANVTPLAGTLYLRFKRKCNAAVSVTAFSTLPNVRSVAIIYANETASGLQARCVDA